MIYPNRIVELYKEMVGIEDKIVEAKNRNFYDKETALHKLHEALDDIEDLIHEEAHIYAAESGADRDGSYDPDRVFDDLYEQINN